MSIEISRRKKKVAKNEKYMNCQYDKEETSVALEAALAGPK
jgi:hypothetical protein